ncbi:MAG: DUF6090 family protein [Saprospiraceae bacterium]
MKQIKQIIREIIPVIIGILVALVINNWNEDRKDQKYLDKIFSSIEKELEESGADIERVIPKQLAMLDTIDTYLNDETVSLAKIVWSANGIQEPEIKINAWNAIANSKLELIEYEKISALSDIAGGKENLRLRTEKMLDFLLPNIQETDRGKKTLLRMMVVDVVNAEKRLQANIEEFIEE